MVWTGSGESWRVEEQQLDARGVLGEEREVDAVGVGRGAERMRAAAFRTVKRRAGACSVVAIGDGHDVAPSAIGGSRSTRFSFASFVSSATIARPLRVRARPSGLPSSCGRSQTSSARATLIADDQLPDPGDRLGLVAQQVEPPVRPDLEVAEVLAGRRQLDGRIPDGERDEDVVALVGRPAGAAL